MIPQQGAQLPNATVSFRQKSWTTAVALANYFGVWLSAVTATLVLPCIPLGIEWMQTGEVKFATITLTTGVLAAGLIFTAEHQLYRTFYILLFGADLLLFTAGNKPPPSLDHWDLRLLFAVVAIHSMERFYWHVALNRPFP